MRHDIRLDKELIRTLEYLDGKNNIIQRMIEIPLQSDEPEIYLALANFTNPVLFRNKVLDPKRYANTAAGAGFTREESLWAIVGEACERYAAGIFDHNDFIYDTYENVADKAINIDRLILYSAKQYNQTDFPFSKFNRKTKRHWAVGRSLMTGREAYIPAQLLYLSYDYFTQDEMLSASLSTGLAAGGTIIDAVFSGLREVLERDALITNWMLKRQAPEIKLEKIKKYVSNEFARLVDEFGQHINPRLITNDIGVPSIFTIVRLDRKDTISVGASCHPDPFKALEKSVLEAFHTRNWVMDMQRNGRKASSIENLKNFDDHVLFYTEPENFHHIEFMFSNKEESLRPLKAPLGNSSDMTRHMLRLLQARGYEAHYFDMTTADVEEVGLNVVKVLVPGLQPLHADHAHQHLDDRRIKEVAEWYKIPYDNSPNDSPHPFP